MYLNGINFYKETYVIILTFPVFWSIPFEIFNVLMLLNLDNLSFPFFFFFNWQSFCKCHCQAEYFIMLHSASIELVKGLFIVLLWKLLPGFLYLFMPASLEHLLQPPYPPLSKLPSLGGQWQWQWQQDKIWYIISPELYLITIKVPLDYI